MSKISYYIDTMCENVSDFKCEYKVFKDYLLYRSDNAVVHYLIEPLSDTLIGYFSLISSGLLYRESDELSFISAIELKMFAIDDSYRNVGVAADIFHSIVKTISHFATEYIGAEVILLYSVPVPYVISLYESEGFQQIDDTFTTFQSEFTDGCVPMIKAL